MPRAMKIMKKKKMSEYEKVQLENEINILKNVDHPNLLKIHEYLNDDK